MNPKKTLDPHHPLLPCPCGCEALCRSQNHSLWNSRTDIHNLASVQRALFILWSYLVAEDMWDEASAYLMEHYDDPTPLDLGMGLFRA